MIKKIIASILISIVALPVQTLNVFATYESKIVSNSELFLQGSNVLVPTSDSINSSGFDKNVSSGIKRLVYGTDVNDGSANLKLNTLTDGILSKDGNIGIYSPGSGFYAPYVPLEFQINIPVAYEKNGVITEISGSENTTLKIPTRSNGTDTSAEVIVYGLDQKGQGLLGFDVYNSNKTKIIYDANKTKNIKFFPEGINVDTIGYTKKDYFNDDLSIKEATTGYFVKKTSTGNNAGVLLGHSNYGVNNGDTDGDGFVENGFYTSKNGFTINSDIFVGVNKNTNNIYKSPDFLASKYQTTSTGNISSLNTVVGNFNAGGFKNSLGEPINAQGAIKDIIDYNQIFNVVLNSVNDFRLTNSQSSGILYRMFNYGGSNGGNKKEGGFKLNVGTDDNKIDGISCADGENHNLDFFKQCLTSVGGYGLKFFQIEADQNGNILSFKDNSQIDMEKGLSVIPNDIYVNDSENNNIFKIGIPVISSSNELNLKDSFKSLDIGNLLKFKSYKNGKLQISIPYILSDKADVNGKLEFKKNVIFSKSDVFKDILEKINTRDISSSDSNLDNDLLRLSSGFVNGGTIEIEKSFSDGGKYVMSGYGEKGVEDTKVISFNPNIIPFNVFVGANESTLKDYLTINPSGKLITLNFSDDNSNNGMNSASEMSTRFSLNTLFRGTPVSKVYIRDGKDGKKYFYKVFIVQLKVNGDVSLGSNENQNLFLGKIEEGIRLYTNPYIINPVEGAFLSMSTRKNSIGFPINGEGASKNVRANIFTQNDKSVLKFNEVDGDNEKIDSGSYPKIKGYDVSIKDFNDGGTVNTYMSLKTTSGPVTINERLKVPNVSDIIIKTPTCIDGYEIYDDYKGFYKALYEDFDMEPLNPYIRNVRNEGSGAEIKTITEYPKTSLLYTLNTAGVNRSEYKDSLTTYFNYPKPFCVNKDWAKNGNVQNLTVDKLMMMLKYYTLGITTTELSNFDETKISLIKDDILNGKNKEYSYITGVTTQSGAIKPETIEEDWYINPINLDQFSIMEPGAGISLGEYNNFKSGKADIFYDQFVLPSFKKLFITDRLIPEQYKLTGNNGAQNFSASNNSLKYSMSNSYFGSKFKFGFTDNESNIKENQFVLNLLEGDNKKFFPIIGANLVITNQGSNGINYCEGSNSYYLAGSCFDSLTGIEKDQAINSNRPKNQFGNIIKKGGATYDFTKINRILSDGTPFALTSGSTYYDNYSNIHGSSPTSQTPTVGFDVLNSSKEIAGGNNDIILNYGRNLGGNLYSFLKLDKDNQNELGFFANDVVNFNWIGTADNNSSITLSGAVKVGSYPFFSPKETSTNMVDTLSNSSLADNIIKVPFHILRNNKTNFDGFTNIYESVASSDTTVDKVYNRALLSYYVSTASVEDVFEKYNGEYGIYVNFGNNENTSSSKLVDYPSGLAKGNSNNGKSKILTVEYSSNFSDTYIDGIKILAPNGIQISASHEDFDNICNNLKSNIGGKDLYNCLLTYNNNDVGAIYKLDQKNDLPDETIVPIKSCVTDPDMESCKTTEIKKIRSPLSDQFTTSQVNKKEYVNDTIFSIGNDKYVGNALKFVSEDNTKKYFPEFGAVNTVKESNGILSRKNIEIDKTLDKSIGSINDFIYNNGSVEDKLQNTINYNSLYNDDSVIITNGRQYFTGSDIIVGGYVNIDGRVDKNYGVINNDYSYSDNDNQWLDNGVSVSSFVLGMDTSQARRDRIRDEIKNNNHAYLTLVDIPKDSFNSINGILRLSKDSRKYFSNMTIQLPDLDASKSQGQLLNEVSPNESIYSFNNLTVTYAGKAYTWGNNDTSCNGVDPNAVYDRIDKYTGPKTGSVVAGVPTRSDTITICLVDKGNSSGLTSSGNTITSNIEVKLPIKPSRGYAKYKGLSGDEESLGYWLSFWNDLGRNKYGYSYSDITLESRIFSSANRYFVGRVNGNGDKNASITGGPYSGNSTSLSNLSIISNINQRLLRCGSAVCYFAVDWSYSANQLPLSFDTNVVSGDSMIKVIPQIYMNGFAIKSVNVVGNSSINIPSYIFSSNKYNSSYNPTSISNGGSYGTCVFNCGYYMNIAENDIITQAKGIPFASTFSISHPNSTNKIDIGNYTIDFVQLPKYDINTYKSEISVKNVINDNYKKTGNLQNSVIGNVTNNVENYITQSLKENDYKVTIGDILTYNIDVDASSLSTVPLQNFILSQTLDRGLDLIPDTLKVNGTNLGNKVVAKPIYNNDADFKSLLKSDTNTEFFIGKTPYKLDTSPAQLSLNTVGSELVVKKGVLFLELLEGGGGNLTSNTTIRYIRNGKNSLNEDNVNGLYSNTSDLDIIDGGTSRNIPGDIIIVKAGENLIRTSTIGGTSVAPKFKVLHTNRIVDSLLKYDTNIFESVNIDTNSNVFGLDPITNGLGASKFTPNYKQNSFFFNSIGGDCPSNNDFGTGALSFTGATGTYCIAPNKYMDYVYKGYLQLSSPYNRLILPDSSNPFIFGGMKGILDIYKNIAGTSAKNINLLRNTERATDREKMIMVNLGQLTKGDKINVSFDVKVNKYNDINHKLFNYTKNNSNGYDDTAISLVRNDVILNNSEYNNTNSPQIYTHAKNTKVFYINHIGGEEVIYDDELKLGDGANTNSLTVVPKTTLSIINLSGRKNYYTCDPEYSDIGSCRKMTTLDTYDKFENFDTSGQSLSFSNWTRFPETNIPMYKGQKILLRVAIDNPYFDLADTKNRLNSAKIHIGYNSNFAIFDDATYVSDNASQTADVGSIDFGFSNTGSEIKTLSPKFKTLLTERSGKSWSVGQETIIKGVQDDYKEIEYSVDTSKINGGKVLVDFLFTIKHTENSANIDKAYLDAYNAKILSSFVSSLEYQVANPTEKVFANTDTNDNSAVSNVSQYLKYNPNALNNNNNFGNINYLYYSIPFDKDFKIDDGSVKTSKTDFNPNSGKLKVRYFDESSSSIGLNGINSGLAIELLNTKDSTTYSSADIVGNLSITLPYGFSTSSVKGYKIEDIDQFNTKLSEDVYINSYDSTKISYGESEKLNKKILTIHPEGITLRPGRRYTLYVYLTFDITKVDRYSTFTVEASLKDATTGIGYSLFGDVQTSSKNQNVFDTIVKTLPTFAENNVFYGNKYTKNNVGNYDYINKNSGSSKYYIIGEQGLPILYTGSGVEAIKYIDSGNKPKLIIDMPKILDMKNNNYSVETLPTGLISPNEGDKTYNFKNNTVYYYDGDINIGDPAVNSGIYTIKLSNNSDKQGQGGITIIANGRIFVNTNIKLDNSGNKLIKDIPNVGFIGLKGTAFNPRTTLVEGYFYSPITSNSVVDPNNNKTDYSEGIINTGYANDSLKFKGALYGGTIFNERTQGCGADTTDVNCIGDNGLSKNQVENFEFNNLLYLNPPPVFRK